MVFATLNVLVGNMRGGGPLRHRHVDLVRFVGGIGRAAANGVRAQRGIGTAPPAGRTKLACGLARVVVLSCTASAGQAPAAVWWRDGLETVVGNLFVAKFSTAPPTWARP